MSFNITQNNNNYPPHAQTFGDAQNVTNSSDITKKTSKSDKSQGSSLLSTESTNKVAGDTFGIEVDGNMQIKNAPKDAKKKVAGKGALGSLLANAKLKKKEQKVDKQFRKTFPALEEFLEANEDNTRLLNQSHRKFYGDQKIFKKETAKCLKFTLKMIWEAEKSGLNEESFKDILTSLGNKRNEIANISKPGGENNIYFGKPRSGTLRTALGGPYSAYVERFAKTGGLINSIDLDIFEAHCSTTLNKSLCQLSCAGDPKFLDSNFPQEVDELCKIYPHVLNIYNDFWKPNDPVFSRVFFAFKEILKFNGSADALKDKISQFHWLFANITPFVRGSAWCGEVLTDACWIYHGYTPMLIGNEKSLDLEALTSSKEDFQKIYPMGIKV